MKILDWLLGGRPEQHGFHGGLHLPAHKAMSTQQPAQIHPLEPRYILSLRQRDGNWLEPLCHIGDAVLKGQAIAQASTPAGLMLHAPTSGIIADIAPQSDIHRSGEAALSIIIEADGKDQAAAPLPPLDENTPPHLLRERIAFCGIAGLGGAGFPTARKLTNQANILLINAAECEPYISCDDMQIREHAAAIVRGAQLSAYIVHAQEIVFGIEDDKPQAIAALKQAIENSDDTRIKLSVVPVRYPSGNSRQLIELTLKRRLPADAHAADAGIICHNSATMKAVHDALLLGIPLIERYLSITGEGIMQPQNRIVRLGTPIAALIAAAGGQKAGTRLLIGGPMMGEPQHSQAAGIGKTTNCLLLLPMPSEQAATDCIRCARCSDACPISLMPQQLYWYSRNLEEKKLNQYRLFDCIECGICASVCPAHIPLVQYYRDSKSALRSAARDKAAAERAKARHEAREARLEREAAERQAKMQAKREALQQRSQGGDKQANQAIAEAAQAAKREAHAANAQRHLGNFDPTTGTRSMPNPAQTGLAPQALSPEDSGKQSAIEAAKARAAAKRAARQQQLSPEEQAAAEKQTKIAAARAKAEARKAARQHEVSSNSGADESTAAHSKPNAAAEREAKLAAARAKAEARKAARQHEASSNSGADENTVAHSEPNVVEEREAKLAAARAKAEARKAARQHEASSNSGADESTAAHSEPNVVAEREAKLATARAKAEARKAARQHEASSNSGADENTAAHSEPDATAEREAKLAAARAKAEARKAARQHEVSSNSGADENTAAHSESNVVAEREAKLAAARAKAEARKQARQAQRNSGEPS